MGVAPGCVVEARPKSACLSASPGRDVVPPGGQLLSRLAPPPLASLLRPSAQGPRGRAEKQWSSVGSPREWPRPDSNPERDAQGTGEAENPRLNKQLETVRFNQQRGLDFPPFSSVVASILVSTGQMRFSDL